MVALQTDAAGHVNYGSSPGGLTYPSPTLSAFSSTWGSSATSITGNDTGGSIAFTGGATPAAGTVVTVTFAQAYPTPPRAVIVQGGPTDQSGAPLFTATAITAGGFTLSAAAGATKSYVVNYFVVPA
jgi:hypothetical protein